MKSFLWAALVAAAAPAWAQQKIETVVVAGNPLGSGDVATPSSVLSGNGLILRRGSSLGETSTACPACRRATSVQCQPARDSRPGR